MNDNNNIRNIQLENGATPIALRNDMVLAISWLTDRVEYVTWRIFEDEWRVEPGFLCCSSGHYFGSDILAAARDFEERAGSEER